MTEPRIIRRAGEPVQPAELVDVANLLAAYADRRPDPAVAAERVAFGTSGHRGSSFSTTFNEAHVLAIAQAICLYRGKEGITGPLFVGIDTHALSQPAFDSALEVFAANGVETMISRGGEYTPTPAVSQAILVHNRGRTDGLADGVVITPSHNPPEDGGFKYNPPNGGPADTDITSWIEKQANALLAGGISDVRRLPITEARRAACVHEYDFLESYVADLGNVIDFDAIRASGIRMGVDPLGGAGVHYWARIAERYRIDLAVVSEQVDPRFGFMTLDWDGRVRMDPSSPYAMRRLVGLKDKYDIAFSCDTDHDRHGIVAPSTGLMPPNHFLAVAIDYLFRHRPGWGAGAAVGKTVVSSAMIDRVAARLGRRLYEVPVGFKWFAAGLFDGGLGFGGEESA
ncbi:MAG TPA: phosphoglucomutase, partial [Reyranella sp.]|nr:phosphoglucomutase [Reyranella sp.]